MSDKFYCQSAIEGWKDSKCDIQCDHCYEYYAPLESPVDVEEAAFKWANEYPGDSWKNHLRDAFKAGWKSNPAKWTDTDVFQIAGAVLSIVNIEPTREITDSIRKVIEEYKQSKQK